MQVFFIRGQRTAMVKIVHYEVYTDSGDGWKLEERFSNEQRYEAVNLAKEQEQNHKKVKIIKEYFDVQDNSYQETVEYVSGFSNRKNAKGGAYSEFSGGSAGSGSSDGGKSTGGARRDNVMTGIIKLLAIIILCLALANFLVTLLTPIVESFAPEEITNPILFVLFFSLFLGIALPLLLKRVPWHVFIPRSSHKKNLDERKFYNRADVIARRYNMNDEFDPQLAPVYPEAPLEFKRYILNFLSDVVSNINSASALQDSFSRLGVKLVVFGGCFELARYSGLSLTEANSLLYEAFKILDGDKTDLEDFYEAKKTYKDNRFAVFLTGVGAYLMGQVILEKPLDINMLKLSFDKWEEQNSQLDKVRSPAETVEKEVSFSCLVNIKNSIEFVDTAIHGLDQQKSDVKAGVRNIIQNLLEKYKSMSISEEDEITTLTFSKLNRAVKFAVDFLNDAAIYADDIADENLLFHCSCTIIEDIRRQGGNMQDYIADLSDQTYDYEIVTTEAINKFRDELDATRYNFDFLGEKTLPRTKKTEAIYKILY